MRFLLAFWKIVRFVLLLILAIVFGLLAIFFWPIDVTDKEE